MHPTQNPAPTGPISPAITLRKAAHYLDLNGWTRERYYQEIPGHDLPAACAVGAIGIAVFGQPPSEPPFEFDRPEYPNFRAAVGVMAEHIGIVEDLDLDDEYVIARWNDQATRTATDVRDALLAAADEWDIDNLGGAL